MTTMNYIVPEVFETGILQYDDTPRGKLMACADGLSMWGLLCAGCEMPPKFGETMAAIGRLLDITPLPENLSRYADAHLGEAAEKERA